MNSCWFRTAYLNLRRFSTSFQSTAHDYSMKFPRRVGVTRILGERTVRDYGKITSMFWTGTTGRELRSDRDAQVVAMYLVTGPMANMIGLYHIPLALISDHTGIPIKLASKALLRVCESGFSRFDGVLEHIFVKEMAAHQIGENLKIKDLRVKGISTMWNKYRKSPFYMDFYQRYRFDFHLPEPAKIEAPTKPLPSQDQEQEQEQEKDQEQDLFSLATEDPSHKPHDSKISFPVCGDPKCPEWILTVEVVDTLKEAYPALDIIGECRKALAWVKSNNSKTAKGMFKYLNGWMGRAANNGNRNGHSPAIPIKSKFETPTDKMFRQIGEACNEQ